MKIAILTTLFPFDEAEDPMYNSRAISDFALEWKALGNAIQVFRPEFHSKETGAGEFRGIQVEKFPISKVPGTDLFFYSSLEKAIRFFSPDVLVCHLATSLVITKNIAGKLCIPFTFGFHKSDLAQFQGVPRYLKSLAQASFVGFRSHSLQKRGKQFLAPGQKNGVIPSGVSEDKITPGKKASGKTVKFITVGRLEPYKKVDWVIQALADIKVQDWEYHIYGDGAQKTDLVQLVKTLGLHEKIIFHGQIDHAKIWTALDQSDVFILVSEETLGIAYLEALARGLVVIGRKNWGIDGIIQDGENGFLFGGTSTKDLSELIERVLQKDHSKIRLASEKTIKEHTSKKAAQKYLDYIMEIVKIGRK